MYVVNIPNQKGAVTPCEHAEDDRVGHSIARKSGVVPGVNRAFTGLTGEHMRLSSSDYNTEGAELTQDYV